MHLYMQEQVNCFYHGQVLDHPEWKVVMDSCQGLRYRLSRVVRDLDIIGQVGVNPPSCAIGIIYIYQTSDIKNL